MNKNTCQFRVVELPFLGTLAQTVAMLTAIVPYWYLGTLVASFALLTLFVAMIASNHKPTAMSALAGLPVIWLAEYWLIWNMPLILSVIGIIVIIDFLAALVTHKVEPIIKTQSRFLWQILVSTTVLIACIAAEERTRDVVVLNAVYCFISGLELIIIWLWALLVQPHKTQA